MPHSIAATVDRPSLVEREHVPRALRLAPVSFLCGNATAEIGCEYRLFALSLCQIGGAGQTIVAGTHYDGTWFSFFQLVERPKTEFLGRGQREVAPTFVRLRPDALAPRREQAGYVATEIATERDGTGRERNG